MDFRKAAKLLLAGPLVAASLTGPARADGVPPPDEATSPIDASEAQKAINAIPVKPKPVHSATSAPEKDPYITVETNSENGDRHVERTLPGGIKQIYNLNHPADIWSTGRQAITEDTTTINPDGSSIKIEMGWRPALQGTPWSEVKVAMDIVVTDADKKETTITYPDVKVKGPAVLAVDSPDMYLNECTRGLVGRVLGFDECNTAKHFIYWFPRASGLPGAPGPLIDTPDGVIPTFYYRPEAARHSYFFWDGRSMHTEGLSVRPHVRTNRPFGFNRD